MTPDIVIVLSILLISLYFFITEKLPMDVVALAVLGALAVTGLVTSEQALSGFSNPAVVTVWAMFILSDGLTRTGIADIIGRQILKLAGQSETRIVVVIMLTAGGLSAFMNNIGVAALMLPVVIDIAGKTGNAPSRLLMPLAYGSLLGGLTTLVGTPPNLLVSNSLTESGLDSFGLFDFTPVGLVVMVVGTLFVALFGRYFLPENTPGDELGKRKSGSLLEQYDLGGRTQVMRIPDDSPLDGHTLAEVRFGSALELSVLAILRDERIRASPGAADKVRSGDQLLVQGNLDRFHEAKHWSKWFSKLNKADPGLLTSSDVGIAEFIVPEDSPLVGLNLLNADLRNQYGVLILVLDKEGGENFRTRLANLVIDPGDHLLLKGYRHDLEALAANPILELQNTASEHELIKRYQMEERFFSVEVPKGSPLIGRSLAESRMGDAFALNVMGIIHAGQVELMLDSSRVIAENDQLLIQGVRDYVHIMKGLSELEVNEDAPLSVEDLESRRAGMVEVVLAPRSNLAGKTPRHVNFIDRYGLQILGIWREGKVILSIMRNHTMRFGDAFLLFGRHRKLKMLPQDPDFMLLTPGIGKPKKTERAPLAALIMIGVMLPVLFGWLPIAISAVVGATLMILTGCLNMNEAYRAIDWRAIFLISGMLPLGQAMDESGAAGMMAEGAMALLGDYGPWPIIIGLYIVTALATTIIPTAALVVMMAPIMIRACMELDASPQAGMMAIAMAASASFTSPISHPANILVMGPGGYRFVDYIKLGAPLAIVVMITVFLTLPFFWPV